jgi:hypothetical protein
MRDDVLEWLRRGNPVAGCPPAPPIESLLDRLDEPPAVDATPGRWHGTVAVVAGIGVAMLVAAVFVIAGRPGPSSPSRLGSDLAGGISAPVRQLVAGLAVLRRPQTAADRGLPAAFHRPGEIASLTRLAVRVGETRLFVIVRQFANGREATAFAVTVTPSGRASPFGGVTAATLRGPLPPSKAPSPHLYASIVPDGVTAVSWEFKPGGTVAAAVHGNVAVAEFLVPPGELSHVTWVGHRHQVIASLAVSATTKSQTSVAAPITLRELPVATYCDGPAMLLVPCRPGQRPVAPQPQRLLQLSFTASRATGVHTWYAWNIGAPRGCPQASDGGPTRSPVRAGDRLVFDDLIPPNCRGTVRATVSYVTEAATVDSERMLTVGQGTLPVP